MTKTNAQVKTKASIAHSQIHTRAGRKTKLTLGELALCSYKLGDGEELQRAAPDTFWMPSSEARAALQVGQTVQLIFGQGWLSPPVTERMWVRITRRVGEGYVGRLANEPGLITALRLGDEVRFEPRNVIKIYSLGVFAQGNPGASNIRWVEAGVNNK